MSDRISDTRLENIINVLTEYSKGNFSVRYEVAGEDDELSTVMSGLNMLGEELDNYRTEIDQKNGLLKHILSSVDEVVYARSVIHDDRPSSPFTFISARSEDIIGLTPEELYAAPDAWLNLMPDEDRAHSMTVVDSILKGNEEVFTYRVFHKRRGEYRWIEDRTVPILNKDGIVTEVYGSARDITDKHKITLELEEKNELVSRIITSSDQTFYVIAIDPEDSFKNTCTYLSWQIEKIQGGTAEDVKNNPLFWFEKIHPNDLESVKEANRRMFSTKQPVTRIYRIKHARTGEYIWLEDYIVPIMDDSGYIREFYGSARDITARKKVELEREKLINELSHKHDELLQFNHIVSHNLRSPVASILGLTQLLDAGTSIEDAATTIAYIKETALAMDEVLHDLNTILSSRSTLKEKTEPFFLSDVIQSVCIILEKEIDETQTTVREEIQPEARYITSIKGYIQSAIFNLVSNAIKYRAEGRFTVIKISAEKKNGHIIISVADNGAGIDTEKHNNRLFTLYGRLNPAIEGKGLGLFMTKTQIESLNGTLTVKSTPGTGSVFTITLPV